MDQSAPNSSFSQEWWRVTLASVGDAVIATDAKGKVIFLNATAESLTGWGNAEATGRMLEDVFVIVNEFTRTRAKNPVTVVLHTGVGSGVGNHQLIARDGRDVAIEDNAAPIRDDDGTLVGSVLIFRNITHRRETELDQVYLAAIVESSDDAIIGKTLDSVITSWNKGAEKIFGYTAEEAIGKPITILIPAERHAEETEILDRLSRGERIDHFVTTRVRKDGVRLTMSLTISPIKDATGKVIGASKIGRDITRQKHDEEALRDAEEHLRLITNNMAAAVTRCSRDLRYIWVSPVYAQLLRRKPEEIEGRSIVDVVGEEGYEALRPHIERVLSGDKEEYESLVNFAGAGKRWIHAIYVPTKDAAGSVTGWVAVVTDITSRKQLEEDRERLLASESDARHKAEEASQLKDEFLATISHELRTPLNAILGWSRLLRTEGLGTKETIQAVETIERNAKNQAQLIEDLLDVSRIISGKLRLDVRTLWVASIVESAITSLKPAADAKGVTLHSVLDPNAGPVSGDASRLQQVVWNLLSNAIKFTPHGGRVQVVVERINSHVEIIVSDTGQGIRPDFLPHVFERFRQADAGTARQHGGLGLGLAIVRQLVELHGGRVSVHSAGEQMGATSTVRLPVQAILERKGEEREHPTAETKRTPPHLEFPNLEDMKVLVVDDEQDTRRLLRAVLEKCGAEVRDAGSTAQGLKLAQEWNPSIIVSDIGMPGEDGYFFIQKFRQWQRGSGNWTPAVALTAYARSEDRLRALSAGYQIHVAKPIEPVEFALIVAGQLGRGR